MSHANDNQVGNALEQEFAHDQRPAFSGEESQEATYVHPQSKKLFEVAPFIRHIPVAGNSIEAFGPVCTSSLALVYLLSKGIGKNLLSFSVYPMFRKRYGVGPEVQQRMSGIGNMGFAVKPVTAILSDTFPLFGYTKRWYMALSCVVGMVCAIVYGALPAKEASAQIAAAMMFLATFCIANVDVLSEGHYSRLIRKLPKPGAHLISWIWAFIMLGTIIAAGIQGPLSDANLPQVGVFIGAATIGLCVFFFIFNSYDEKTNRVDRLEDFEVDQLIYNQANEPSTLEKTVMVGELEDTHVLSEDSNGEATSVPLNDSLVVTDTTDMHSSTDYLWVEPKTCCCNVWEVNEDVVKRNVTVTIYGMLLTVGVVILAILTIVGDTNQLLIGCIIISAVLCATGFLCIPYTVMKANLFGWAQLCSYILIPGAMDNFFMADEACVPGGPNFSQTFYQTVGSLIGNIAGLVGVYAFAMIFSKRSYRVTCICTTIIQVVASIFDLIIVKRWNRPHMPDHAMYILGDAIVYQVCYMLNYMPLNILISRLCPKGCESTMFAILASFSNLGASTSSTIGAILMETVWPVNVNVTPCDFSNVPWLIITGHLICPLIAIPLVFLLLPGDRICDDLDPKLVEAIPIGQRWLNNWRKKKTAEATSEEKAMEPV